MRRASRRRYHHQGERLLQVRARTAQCPEHVGGGRRDRLPQERLDLLEPGHERLRGGAIRLHRLVPSRWARGARRGRLGWCGRPRAARHLDRRRIHRCDLVHPPRNVHVDPAALEAHRRVGGFRQRDHGLQGGLILAALRERQPGDEADVAGRLPRLRLDRCRKWSRSHHKGRGADALSADAARVVRQFEDERQPTRRRHQHDRRVLGRATSGREGRGRHAQAIVHVQARARVAQPAQLRLGRFSFLDRNVRADQDVTAAAFEPPCERRPAGGGQPIGRGLRRRIGEKRGQVHAEAGASGDHWSVVRHGRRGRGVG